MGFKINVDGSGHNVEIVARRPHLRLRIEDREYEISASGDAEDGRQTFEIAGKPAHFARAHLGDRQIVRMAGRTVGTSLVDPRSETDADASGHDHVRAPMPGSVMEVHKQPGETITRGETLITIESMKLQMALLAPRDGRLARLLRGVGDKFDKDEIVAELEPMAVRD
jgi:acetyl/propionyl-CoA carboxylase alpha subunit